MDNNYTVYLHLNKINGKRYYGITSLEPKNRWHNGKGYPRNKHFTDAINLYGWENFEHIIVAKGLTKEEAGWIETVLIAEYDTTNPDKGYNITKGGEGTKGVNPRDYMTEETKIEQSRKLSEAKKGKYCGKNHPYAKSVIAIINDKIFGVFDYITQGAEYFGCNIGHISDCCKGKYKSCGKYNGQKIVWRYITIIEL